LTKTCAFEVTTKRRKGFPSESGVKRDDRVVGGAKELVEKLGRNDPCPCGSARSFQALLPAQRLLLTASIVLMHRRTRIG
jgi:SEC-C motif